MAKVTDYLARIGIEEYQSSLFTPVRGYHLHKDVWDPHLGDGFTTKISTLFLPVDCHSEIVPPWRMNRQHSLNISLGKCPTFLLLFPSTDRTTTAYLSCRLFRSCFVVKPWFSKDPTRLCKCGSHVHVPHTKSPLVFHHLGFVHVDPGPL